MDPPNSCRPRLFTHNRLATPPRELIDVTIGAERTSVGLYGRSHSFWRLEANALTFTHISSNPNWGVGQHS